MRSSSPPRTGPVIARAFAERRASTGGFVSASALRTSRPVRRAIRSGKSADRARRVAAVRSCSAARRPRFVDHSQQRRTGDLAVVNARCAINVEPIELLLQGRERFLGSTRPAASSSRRRRPAAPSRRTRRWRPSRTTAASSASRKPRGSWRTINVARRRGRGASSTRFPPSPRASRARVRDSSSARSRRPRQRSEKAGRRWPGRSVPGRCVD